MPGFPGAPMRLPADAFIELEPVTTARGRKLRRFKLKVTGWEYTEVDPDEGLFKVEVIERKPLPMPETGFWARREAEKAEEDNVLFRALDALNPRTRRFSWGSSRGRSCAARG